MSTTQSDFHILLIEDSRADAKIIERALREGDVSHRLTVIANGRDALDYLYTLRDEAVPSDREPDLILLDLNLPGMSGLECLRRIKADARTREIPVAVLTVSKSDRMIVECGRLGAENYIVKPLSIESFLRVTPKLNLRLTLSALGNGGRRSLTL